MVTISGELKSKIDGLWDIFWAGGSESSPVTIIEQITYLMFIRDLDDMDIKASKDANLLGVDHKSIFDGQFTTDIGRTVWDKKDFKWSVFKDMPSEQMFDTVSSGVFPFIKSLHNDSNSTYSKYLAEARFTIPNPTIFQEIVSRLDDIYKLMSMEDKKDIRGDVYEYLLGEISTQKNNGQFRTPRHIIKMMVELMKPAPGDIIGDPACGTAGFLVAASEYLMEHYHDEILHNDANLHHFNNSMFTGFDKDPTMLRIAAMNMMLHSVENPNISKQDSLSQDSQIADGFSLIMANPPFTGTIVSKSLINPELLKISDSKKTELLFLALMIKMLRIGGRCAVIVPDGVMFGGSNAHKAIRKEIVDNNQLIAVISMPSGVFKPYSGVSTSILVFNRTGNGGTEDVWFYDIESDGYTLDDKRSKIDTDDIPDVISRFNNLEAEKERSRTDRSFLVPVKEIRENDYDLSYNKYRKVEYEAEVYRPSNEILDEIITLNESLTVELKKLREML